MTRTASKTAVCLSCYLTKPVHARGYCRICYYREVTKTGSELRSIPQRWHGAELERLKALFDIEPPLTYGAMATKLGVTLNTVAGACWRNGLVRGTGESSTTEERLDAWHKKLDAVMAIPVKRIPNSALAA